MFLKCSKRTGGEGMKENVCYDEFRYDFFYYSSPLPHSGRVGTGRRQKMEIFRPSVSPTVSISCDVIILHEFLGQDRTLQIFFKF